MTRSDFTDAFFGFSVLLNLEFSCEPVTGTCKLELHLVESENHGAKGIRAEFTDVFNLCMKDVGGGLTQLEFLLIEDISERQLDRINYQVSETERESLSFLCRTIVVTELGEGRSI